MSDGTKNLISLADRATDKQREIQSKGGKARAKQRRDRRSLREALQAMLELSRTAEDGEPIINPITGKPMSVVEEISVSTIMEAINGNIKAVQTILDVLGERSLKIDNTISGGLDAGITITHIVCDHTPAATEAEVIEREGIDYE